MEKNVNHSLTSLFFSTNKLLSYLKKTGLVKIIFLFRLFSSFMK